MNGQGSYLLVYGELQSAVLVRNSASHDGGDWKQSLYKTAHSGIVDAVQFS